MVPKKASARLRRRADLESDSEFEPTPLALLPTPGEPPGGAPPGRCRLCLRALDEVTDCKLLM